MTVPANIWLEGVRAESVVSIETWEVNDDRDGEGNDAHDTEW